MSNWKWPYIRGESLTAMKKVYIFHIITSLIFFTSVGTIFFVLGVGKSTFSPETTPSESSRIPGTALRGEVQKGGVPFTIEEFELAQQIQQGTGKNIKFSFFLGRQLMELPILMEHYLYTPGLSVTLFASEELDPSSVEIIPGQGVFYLSDHIRKGERWICEVLVNNHGRNYTMYIAEESLIYVDFYGSPPAAAVISAHEDKRMEMRNAIEAREEARQAAYQTALDEYWAMEAQAHAGFFDSFNMSGIRGGDTQNTRSIIVYVGVGIGGVILVGAMLFAFGWVRRNRMWQRDFTFDDITESEMGMEPKAEEHASYSAFAKRKTSKRGSDYYDPKEDHLEDDPY